MSKMDVDDFFRENSDGIFKWISINFFDIKNYLVYVTSITINSIFNSKTLNS